MTDNTKYTDIERAKIEEMRQGVANGIAARKMNLNQNPRVHFSRLFLAIMSEETPRAELAYQAERFLNYGLMEPSIPDDHPALYLAAVVTMACAENLAACAVGAILFEESKSIYEELLAEVQAEEAFIGKKIDFTSKGSVQADMQHVRECVAEVKKNAH